MKTGLLIGNFLTKCGIDTKDKALADVLAIGTEIPDDIANKLETGLMTEDSAASNESIVKKISGKALANADTAIKHLLENAGFDQSVIDEVTKEEKTTKKITLLATRVKELKDSKAAAPAGDKAEIQKKIDKYEADLKQAAEDRKKVDEDWSSKYENDMNDLRLDSILATRKFAFPKDTPIDRQIAMAKVVLRDEFIKKGVKVKYENGVPKLLKATDGTEYFDDKHNKVELQSFIDGAFAQNNLLAVSEPDKVTEAGKKAIIPGDLPASNKAFLSDLDKQIADMTAEPTS